MTLRSDVPVASAVVETALKRRSRRLLETTNTDDNAIAAPAMRGSGVPGRLKTSHDVEPGQAGDTVETTLASFAGETRMWPDDGEFTGALLGSDFYSLSKPRIRAFLASIENHLRDGQAEEAGRIRADTSQLNFEHVLPQSWQTHWPLPDTEDPERALELHERAINAV